MTLARVWMSERSEKLHELLCLMRPQTATHAVALAKKICTILEWDRRKEPKGMPLTARSAVFNYCEEHRLPALVRVNVPGAGVGNVVETRPNDKILVRFDNGAQQEFSVLDLEVLL